MRRRVSRRTIPATALRLGLALTTLFVVGEPAYGQTTWVPTTFGSGGTPYAISDLGQAVGSRFTGTASMFEAFSWTPAGGLVVLGTLNGRSTYAVGVNDG